MRLFKRSGSPFWWMDFTANGTRVRQSTERLLSDRSGAQRVMAQEYQRRMNLTQLGDKPDITLDEAFAITLEEVGDQTRRLYKASSEALRRSLGGNSLLSGISTADVTRHASARRRAGLKANTIRSDLKALKRVMNRVRTTHRVNVDISWPKIEKFTKTRYLSDQEEMRIIRILTEEAESNVTAQKAYTLFVFLIDTGMRLMEAVDIEWSAIDLTSRRIEVYRPKTRTVSVVPISDRVYALLKSLHNQPRPFQNMEWAVRYLRKKIDLVCNQNHREVETRGKATIHTLRDTYASRMLKRGISIYKLAKLLGHSNAAMTEKYGHLEVNDVVDEARRLINL